MWKTEPFTTFLRELLEIIKEIDLETDASWVLRFKPTEIVGWSDKLEARPPDLIIQRPKRGPVGKIHLKVINGVGSIANMTFKEESTW